MNLPQLTAVFQTLFSFIWLKSEYIRRMGLGGGMVWALDLDDFGNRCQEGSYPLMNTIKQVLGPESQPYDGELEEAADDMTPQTNLADEKSESYKVVCCKDQIELPIFAAR